MNPLKAKFFEIIKTIKPGESIEFDLAGDTNWPEAYSSAKPYLDKAQCGIDIILNRDQTQITIKRGSSSPDPVNVPVFKESVVEVEVDLAEEVKPEPEETVKKPWWGNNQWNND